MPDVIIFNKPFRVLCQFSDNDATEDATENGARQTLADYLTLPEYRAAGRLDFDSEGLLVLTDDGRLQQHIAHPRYKSWKTYWVQVEGLVHDEAIAALAHGVELKDGTTLPARVRRLINPKLWDRSPPIRYRPSVPDSWLEISLCEGRNRQVRRMTAAVGFPTLRLVRVAVGDWALDGLQPGQFRKVKVPSPPVNTHRRSTHSHRNKPSR